VSQIYHFLCDELADAESPLLGAEKAGLVWLCGKF